MGKNILEVLNYVKKFSGMRLLIKLGGSILNNSQLIEQLCHDLSMLHAANIQLVIVHGGGKAINAALDKHKIPSRFENGLRVTDQTSMDIIETTLVGEVNQLLVRKLNANGAQAVGLSGCSNSLFECQPFSNAHGLVGDITKIETSLIEHLLNTQTNDRFVPVIAPIGMDKTGQAYNINADWAASHLASALNVDKLIYLTDQDGILDQSGQRLSELDKNALTHFINNETITSGMLTKVRAILSALKHGIDNIHIINGKTPHSLVEELFTDSGIGTLCTNQNLVHQAGYL